MSDQVLSRMMSNYVKLRIGQIFSTIEAEKIHEYLQHLIETRNLPPMRGPNLDWQAITEACGIDKEKFEAFRSSLRPALESLIREIPKIDQLLDTNLPCRLTTPENLLGGAKEKLQKFDRAEPETSCTTTGRTHKISKHAEARRGPAPKEIVEFPAAHTEQWDDPCTFHEALALHMKRHNDSGWHLHQAIVRNNESFDRKTLTTWCRGTKIPSTLFSFEILTRIERRYRLPIGYFRSKLLPNLRSTINHAKLPGIAPSERRRLAWHLPEDFNKRPPSERNAILDWVHKVIISGSTDYRLYQAAAAKHRYAVSFPGALTNRALRPNKATSQRQSETRWLAHAADQIQRAPDNLLEEMRDFTKFKTDTLTAVGYSRIGVWGDETASQKLEHFGLLFGALLATPESNTRGLGADPNCLTMALLAFPSTWDWYVRWRESRRGFFTAWEIDMLRQAQALTRRETGWLRQNPELANKLKPINGLITQSDIDAAMSDWDRCCDTLHKFASVRAKEIQRVARVHRDPFEPILPILESDSPVGEYRKITEEILRLMPDEKRQPIGTAEAVRSFLMLRIGLHSGLRQKNLRQLLCCHKNQIPMSEKRLIELRCGELRWIPREQIWEIFIPTIAFKNSTSSYFGNRPFQLSLPDIGRLYEFIDSYMDRHRSRLLHQQPDPGTFFVKTTKITSKSAAYDQNTFYEAWRLTIQRYGIYNPYTGRGAIVGLLPHGPHNIRDVLATHILKKTGSYEQASYAIQDTPDMVAQHYGRFLPQDKSALAARILNQVWVPT